VYYNNRSYSPDYGVHSLYDGVDLGDGVREKKLVGPYSAIGLLEDSLQPVHQDAQGMTRGVECLRRKSLTLILPWLSVSTLIFVIKGYFFNFS
jgi:hypothetical protein